MSGLLDVGYRRLLRPVLFHSGGGDPEVVHDRTLRAVARLGQSRPAVRAVAGLCAQHRTSTVVAGIAFPGLVGLAAGLDKNGVGVAAWSALGFSHAELGTVTAVAQPGNDRPRLFRLVDSQALVNRMGFNNAGAQALASRLERAGVRRGNGAVGLPLGVSIGKTKTTPVAEATEDYLTSLRLVGPYADYVAVNVSSPNTAGLRSLQDAARLRRLTAALVAEARRLANLAGTPDSAAGPVPIFVKIAPDLDHHALEEVLEVCADTGVAGLVATNTTLARDGIAPGDLDRAAEAGGLSGAPLTVRARKVVSFLAHHTDLPIIGCGGIVSADDGRALLDAGARLLQLYTGFIYRGPALVRELNALPLPATIAR
jgi:dihydroorotate dehydrogenase